jgi:hypothetical protein
MGSERTFNNIINFTVGANTASTAIQRLMTQLDQLVNNARIAGTTLDSLFAKGGGAGRGPTVTSFTPAQSAEAARIREEYAKFMQSTGQPLTGAPMLSASQSAKASGALPSSISIGKSEISTGGMTPEIQAQLIAAMPGVTASTAAIHENAKAAVVAGGAHQQLSEKVEKSGRSFASHVQGIVTGMLVWQGMNLVMNTAGGVISTVTTETARLDSVSARLSVTLNTSKENAKQYAQALSMMGVAYGQSPETSQGLGFYASRVNKAPSVQQDLFKTSSMLGGVTGEDPKKLIDDLNVAYRQTGISVTTLGDMAAKAWVNSGTKASDFLNILREIGPLAKESGIDIEKMAGVAALSADRMGGSMSDAAATMTRLIKAVQDPNELQKSVLQRYGVNYGKGADVQEAMNKISQSNMSATDMAALGGRPGQPAVANDIRTMLAVFKDYKGELQTGKGLQDQFAQSMNSIDGASKRLDASFKSIGTSLGQSPLVSGVAITAIDALGHSFLGLGKAVDIVDALFKSSEEKGFFKTMGIWDKTLLSAVTGKLPAVPSSSNMPTEVQRAQAAGGMSSQFTGTNVAAGGAEKAPPELLPFPTSETDISKYTRAQYESALAMTGKLFDNWMKQYEAMLRTMMTDENSIANAMADERKRIGQTNMMLQSGSSYQNLQGSQAYFLQMALGQQKEPPDTSKLEGLKDKLSDLKKSLEELDDTEKKRAQLEGQWNIPAGAKLLVPLTQESQALMKEHGGESEDQSKERRRQQILREIASTEEKIKKEEANLAKQTGSYDIFANTVGRARMALEGFIGTLGSWAIPEKDRARLGDESRPTKSTPSYKGPTQPTEKSLEDYREPEGAWAETSQSSMGQHAYDSMLAIIDKVNQTRLPDTMQGQQERLLQANMNIKIAPAQITMSGRLVGQAVWEEYIHDKVTIDLNRTAQASGMYSQQ